MRSVVALIAGVATLASGCTGEPIPLPPSSAKPAPSAPATTPENLGPEAWIDGVSVEAMRATTKKVQIEANGRLKPTEEPCFVVYLRINNQTENKKLDYSLTWSGINSRDSGFSGAELKDEHDNNYKPKLGGLQLPVVYGTMPLENETANLFASTGQSLLPKKAMLDAVFFEPPIEQAKIVTLTLWGNNLGLKSKFKLRFPKDYRAEWVKSLD